MSSSTTAKHAICVLQLLQVAKISHFNDSTPPFEAAQDAYRIIKWIVSTFWILSSLFLGSGAVGPKLLKCPARAFNAEYVFLKVSRKQSIIDFYFDGLVWCSRLSNYILHAHP